MPIEAVENEAVNLGSNGTTTLYRCRARISGNYPGGPAGFETTLPELTQGLISNGDDVLFHCVPPDRGFVYTLILDDNGQIDFRIFDIEQGIELPAMEAVNEKTVDVMFIAVGG